MSQEKYLIIINESGQQDFEIFYSLDEVNNYMQKKDGDEVSFNLYKIECEMKIERKITYNFTTKT